MTIGEIIERVQTIYSKGTPSDDSRLTSRFIYSKLLSVRAKLISQEAKKNQLVNQWNYQTLPCVELEEMPLHQCPCIPPIGTKMLRSKYPLPKPLTDLSKHLIQWVTSIEGSSNKIDKAAWESINYRKANKYTANKTVYLLKDGYLWVSSRKPIAALAISMLCEDPIEGYNFPSYCCSNTPSCIPYVDLLFPLDLDAVDTAVDMVIQELVEVFDRSGDDQTNNSLDDAIAQPKR